MKLSQYLTFVFTISLGLLVSHASYVQSQEQTPSSPALDDPTREAMWRYLDSLFAEEDAPEGAQMFTAIFSGSQMGAGDKELWRRSIWQR